jgi:hypothetical protein
LKFVATNLGLPRVIAALNTGFVHPWGQGGYLAPANGAFDPPPPPVAADTLRTDPVGGLTRSLGALNDCGEPLEIRHSEL